ncbi:hypothetical protein K9U39_12645 [Rhodoblastus acidophilus]|uniref:Uncharacterized protein n=1 Tax=Candidatus Rhodoblastus alkanivorans TaxID=2954117 RepID=A0ABS9Z9Y0_9HYPH|nr:hypothetical protein [Candidatus Rhodoblastus alkanivorans]MCI4677105.1 hypothetical protein [Candidatus Rhodoblastus alkanivorans]MCI4684458.1 hypothetical protein [Candidatus Rhodoblastus alkanivorans]MDI4641779.1 hypothetical protein [Rhodoblastus acidophilus]
MTSIESTAFAGLEKEKRLLNATFKGPTGKPGYFGFRGDFALEFQQQLADEARPPEFKLEQILSVAKEGAGKIEILVGYLHDFAYFDAFKKVVLPLLAPEGTYFIFVNNIDLLAKYTVEVDGVTFTILPCDESTVWKEVNDFCGLDKNDYKKLDAGGKLQFVLDKLVEAKETFETLSLSDALSRAEPVKNRNENRPV